MAYRTTDARGPGRVPQVTYVEAVQVEADPVATSYRHVHDEPTFQAAARPRRGAASQGLLEFAWALTQGLLGVVVRIIGLGMPFGLIGVVGFLGLYALIRVDDCLVWAFGSGVVAFASFTYCYLQGKAEAAIERFVARGRS